MSRSLVWKQFSALSRTMYSHSLQYADDPSRSLGSTAMVLALLR